MPDTQGLAPGIAGAGSAIAGALGTYAGWKRDDKVRADQQAFAAERDEARMGHESSMIDKRMARDMQMFGMEQDAQKQEREAEKAMADEQLRAANAGKAAFLMQAGYDPTAIKAASAMQPKAASEFLESAMAQAGLELRARMDAEQAKQKASMARQTFPILDPLTGRPHQGHFITGHGVTLPRDGATPDPFSPQILEGMAKAGMKPNAATIGGVQFKSTDATPREPRLLQDANGEFYRFDGPTGKLVPVPKEGQSAPPDMDPANAIRSILQSRQK